MMVLQIVKQKNLPCQKQKPQVLLTQRYGKVHNFHQFKILRTKGNVSEPDILISNLEASQ